MVDAVTTGEREGKSMAMKWYVVHTYSGHENKARLSLQERVKQMGKEAQFGQVLIPTESVLEMVKGQRRTTTRKFYPGYMFVQMELNEETFHLVKNTPKITGFLGGTNPTPVPEKDIAAINSQMSDGADQAEAAHQLRRGRERPRHRRAVRQLRRHRRRGEGRRSRSFACSSASSAAPRRSSSTSLRSKKRNDFHVMERSTAGRSGLVSIFLAKFSGIGPITLLPKGAS